MGRTGIVFAPLVELVVDLATDTEPAFVFGHVPVDLLSGESKIETYLVDDLIHEHLHLLRQALLKLLVNGRSCVWPTLSMTSTLRRWLMTVSVSLISIAAARVWP